MEKPGIGTIVPIVETTPASQYKNVGATAVNPDTSVAGKAIRIETEGTIYYRTDGVAAVVGAPSARLKGYRERYEMIPSNGELSMISSSGTVEVAIDILD